MKVLHLALRILGSALLVGAPWMTAHAGVVDATLAATYFEVADGSDPDFNANSTPAGIGPTLGVNGLPTATGGVSDIDPATGQLTWWSPTLNSHVIQTGTGTIALPFSSDMYAPNSSGGNDSSYFETAMFTGAFTLAATEDVEFQLGSDDDSFIYVDGILIGDNPGIHGVTNVDFTADGLGAGQHTLEVFYDDRQNTGASLSLNLLSDDVVITPPAPPAPAASGVPEPGTLPLLGIALAGLGWALRRRSA